MANSIKPITFAEPRTRRAVVIAFAAASALLCITGVRQAQSLFALAQARHHLQEAEASPRGEARDQSLKKAGDAAAEARATAPRNGAAHLLLSRIQWLQATSSAANGVSDVLVKAALQSAKAAERFAPDAAAAAMLALTQAQSEPQAGGENLARSYLRARIAPAIAGWRLEAAGRLHAHLLETTLNAAKADACILARTGGRDAAEAIITNASAPAFAALMSPVVASASCGGPA